MRLLMNAVSAAIVATMPFAALAGGQPTCSSDQFHELDFWLGNWNAQWDGGGQGPAGRGTNHITRSYEGCVIEEHFSARPGAHLEGHSVSTFFMPAKEWRQTWVDNEGGYIDLKGGPDGKGDFVLTTLPRAESSKASRMIFSDIKKHSFLWRWQTTLDGKKWIDSWVIHYSRV